MKVRCENTVNLPKNQLTLKNKKDVKRFPQLDVHLIRVNGPGCSLSDKNRCIILKTKTSKKTTQKIPKKPPKFKKKEKKIKDTNDKKILKKTPSVTAIKGNKGDIGVPCQKMEYYKTIGEKW